MRAIQDPVFPHLVWLRPTMAVPSRPSTLADLPFFRGADAAALAKVAAAARWRTVEPGHVVVDDDEPSTDIFFVAAGAVRVQLRTASGREVLLNEFGAGEFFGELSAIDGAPRAANVTAVSRSRLCIIPAKTFLDWAISAEVMSAYAKVYPVTAYATGVAVPEGYPAEPEKQLIKNDFSWAAANRARILDEWSRRYDGKSEAKK